MGTPALQDHPVASYAPPEPVPVAFLGRTSTLVMQDPVASLNRQLREVKGSLPPGWFIAAHYWDVESGGLDLDERGQGTAHQALKTGIPRDGGLDALLAEAGGPAPRFAAVMCEDIERSGRDTFNALKLERQLGDAGIPLFATDEPINVEGMNATTILVRRVKQGVAEWLRYQIKEKAWHGFEQHTIDGYNMGAPPHGYTGKRIPHPNPMKAAQGRTKTLLVLDPPRDRAVADIFTWRTVDRLGINTIASKLNADPDTYPAPHDRGWTVSTVAAILANPKYTGHQVFGRRRRIPGGRSRRFRKVPREQWLWSPQPVHPAIIDRAIWEAAQDIGADHANTTDDPGAQIQPTARRTYVLRSRIRHRDCNRRMTGTPTYPYPGHPGYVYYACSHDPTNPRHAAARPDHPKTVRVREDALMQVIAQFLDQRVFGPDRAAHLAALLPATDADNTARREPQAAALRQQLRKIDASENAHAREIENLANLPHDAPAVTALRTRIIARFGELEDDRAGINKQLAALTHAPVFLQDPTLLDALPTLAGILTGAPPRLQAQLFAALDLQLVYKKDTHQVTIYATLTPATPHTLAAIINTSEPPTTTSSMRPSTQHNRVSWLPQPRHSLARDGSDVGQRAGGRYGERLADDVGHVAALGSDPLRREVEHDDALRAHTGVPGHGVLPVVRRQMPGSRVGLRRNPRLRPPAVRLGKEFLADHEARVEHRYRQAGPHDQVAEVALRGGPYSLGDFGQGLAQQRGTPDRPTSKLFREMRDWAPAPLDGLGDHRADVPKFR
jgi:site-specific DNA recombinase